MKKPQTIVGSSAHQPLNLMLAKCFTLSETGAAKDWGQLLQREYVLNIPRSRGSIATGDVVVTETKAATSRGSVLRKEEERFHT